MKYYLAIKRDEAVVHATTGRDLEKLMVSERIQSQKMAYYTITFICNVQENYGDIK